METSNRKYISTSDLAYTFGVKSTTIHRTLCIKGHYMGIRPIKLPNGRLLWAKDAIQKIMKKTIR